MRSAVLHTAVIFLLGGTFAICWSASKRGADSLVVPLDQLPKSAAGWRAEHDVMVEPSALAVLRPTSYAYRTYRKGSDELSLLVAYYANQRAGESMHSPKNCLPGSGWEIWRFRTVSLPGENGPVEVNDYSVQNGVSRLKVLYWYQSRKRIFANEYKGKAYLIWDALTTGVASGSLVRITTRDTLEASEQARQFAQAIIPEIQRSLGR